MAAEKPKTKVIAENRRAKFDYFLEDYTEAGIQLTRPRSPVASLMPTTFG